MAECTSSDVLEVHSSKFILAIGCTSSVRTEKAAVSNLNLFII